MARGWTRYGGRFISFFLLDSYAAEHNVEFRVKLEFLPKRKHNGMVLKVLALASSVLKVCAMDSSPNPGMHPLCLAPKEHTCLGSSGVMWFMYQKSNALVTLKI